MSTIILRQKIRETQAIIAPRDRHKDIDWSITIDKLLEVLVLMHYTALFNDLNNLSYDKQRYFYYDIHTSEFNADEKGRKYTHLSKSQRDFVIGILHDVGCATYME